MAANRYFVVYDNLYIICYYPAILTYLTRTILHAVQKYNSPYSRHNAWFAFIHFISLLVSWGHETRIG